MGSGAKFWVGSKILGQEQNFVLGAKFHVEVANFVLGETFWVWGENILEIGQFNAKKNLPDRSRRSSSRRTGE